MGNYTNDLHSLSHTKWCCKYITLCSHQSTAEKHFMKIGDLQLAKFFGNYVIGKA